MCTRLTIDINPPQCRASRSRLKLRLLVIACLLAMTCLLSLINALVASEPLAKGIQDNSFFIEEAYNQEPGVVQHIFNLPIDFTNSARASSPPQLGAFGGQPQPSD